MYKANLVLPELSGKHIVGCAWISEPLLSWLRALIVTLTNEYWYARHVGTVVMSQFGPLEGHRTMMLAVRFEM
jgi:hypothetical protein